MADGRIAGVVNDNPAKAGVTKEVDVGWVVVFGLGLLRVVELGAAVVEELKFNTAPVGLKGFGFGLG